jgi:hypothetical protein
MKTFFGFGKSKPRLLSVWGKMRIYEMKDFASNQVVCCGFDFNSARISFLPVTF